MLGRMRIPILLGTVLLAMASQADDSIIKIITGDFNKDGLRDAAMVVEPQQGDDDNGLRIYLGEGYGGRLKLTENIRNFVWGNNVMAGQLPGLEALANGSFVVTSQNEAIGRNRWSKRVTIAFRNGAFIVAGYTYSDYDTLEPGNTTNCDLNLLSGKGILNEKAISFKAIRQTVVDWVDYSGFQLCKK